MLRKRCAYVASLPVGFIGRTCFVCVTAGFHTKYKTFLVFKDAALN